MIASPMNFSIVPPCFSSARLISSKYRVITSRSASESSCSPRLVEPLRSEKTIVTDLSVSWEGPAGSAATSATPHQPQNRNWSGTSPPQAEQVIIASLCGRGAGDDRGGLVG